MNIHQKNKLVEQARLYLRKHDFTAGYFPQLILDEFGSEGWAMLWYSVRYIDNILDSKDNQIFKKYNNVGFQHVIDFLSQKAPQVKDTFQKFREIYADTIPLSLLDAMYESVVAEQKRFRLDAPEALSDYIDLIDKKSVVPLYIFALLDDVDLNTPKLKSVLVWMGRCIQWFDDLLDLQIDLDNNKLFITKEEFEILGIQNVDQIRGKINEIIWIRTTIFMEMSQNVYLMNSAFLHTKVGKFSQAVLEGAWKMIADQRAYPLPLGVFTKDFYYRHYVGITSLPMDLMPTSEYGKFEFFHRVVNLYIKHYKPFDFLAAKELLITLRKKEDLNIDILTKRMTFDISSEEKMELEQKVLEDKRKLYYPEEAYGISLWNATGIFQILSEEFSSQMKHINTPEDLFLKTIDAGFEATKFNFVISHEILENLKRQNENLRPYNNKELSRIYDSFLESASTINDHGKGLFEDLKGWLKK